MGTAGIIPPSGRAAGLPWAAARLSRPRQPLLGSGRLLPLLVLVTVGVASVRELRLGIAVALVALAVGAALWSVWLGAGTALMLWLLLPFIRRLVDLALPFTARDPLSVVPFVATLLVALLTLKAVPLDPRAKRVLLLAGCGLAIGIPTGLGSPAAAAYGVLAYASALSALALGYREQVLRPDRPAVLRLALLVTPALALYGIYQYFVAPPGWDQEWLAAVDNVTFTAPQEGHIRIFATLNAPVTFAFVLGISLVWAITSRRIGVARAGVVGLLLLALALTYVRAAWVALAVAIIVYALAGRGAARARGAMAVGLAIVAAVYMSGGNSTGLAVVERLTSTTAVETDTSAQARIKLASGTIAGALHAPLGHGIGRTGLASRLGDDPAVGRADNGYMAVLYQVGPPGFLLVLAAMVLVVRAGVQTVRRAGPRRMYAAALLSVVAFCLVFELFTDVLYGVSGFVFWYVCGVLLALHGATAAGEPSPRWTAGGLR